MARFVFRAEAALHFRRQQEQVATRLWSAALALLEQARRAEVEAEQAIGSALADAVAAHDPARQAWHRNWIVRLKQQHAQRRQKTVECQAALDAALARVNLARRDVKALERLRARAYSTWQLAERRAEQKELDWLGSVQYAMRMTAER